MRHIGGILPVGTWLSLVEHSLGVRGVGSSNLPVPTIQVGCQPSAVGVQNSETASTKQPNEEMPHSPRGCEKWGICLEYQSCHLMVKVSVFDFPPPGAGFLTSTETVPEDATAAAGT
jgi:hypothetical protein